MGNFFHLILTMLLPFKQSCGVELQFDDRRNEGRVRFCLNGFQCTKMLLDDIMATLQLLSIAILQWSGVHDGTDMCLVCEMGTIVACS